MNSPPTEPPDSDWSFWTKLVAFLAYSVLIFWWAHHLGYTTGLTDSPAIDAARAAANAARLEACPPPRPDPDAEFCADLLDTIGEHLLERGQLSPAPIEREPY